MDVRYELGKNIYLVETILRVMQITLETAIAKIPYPRKNFSELCPLTARPHVM